jgi:nicotinamidase/pyrazinamidase
LKKEFIISQTDALIVTDIQIDFLLGGALPVSEGDQIIPVLNEYITLFKNANAKIFVTRDWHPANHVSFKEQGGPWPPHCVQNSEGARFHPLLKLPNGTTVISKATDPLKEAYSALDGTELAEELKNAGVSRVFVGGLTTDYCVKNTILDALKLGYCAVFLRDASRGINVNPGDAESAIEVMIKSGAEQATLTDFPEPSVALPTDEPESEGITDEPLNRAEIKKKIRMRSRGPYRKVLTER